MTWPLDLCAWFDTEVSTSLMEEEVLGTLASTGSNGRSKTRLGQLPEATEDLERIFGAPRDPTRRRIGDQVPSSTNVARSSGVGHHVVERAAGLADGGGSIHS